MTAQTKKSDTAKMSQIGKVTKTPPSKMRALVRWILWSLLALLVIFGIVSALIWHNRASLMESQIRKLLAQQGYDVALEIRELSKSRAVVSDIKLRKAGEVFFKSEHMVVDYDIGKRMAQRIKFYKPYINVEMDTKGKITSDWMQAGSSSGQKLLLPPDGLVIEYGTVNWRLMQDTDTALGSGLANISVDIVSDTEWSANVSGTNAVFNSDILKGDISHDVFVETNDGQSFDIFGNVDGQAFATHYLLSNHLQAQALESQFKLKIIRAQTDAKPEISGWLNTQITGLSLPDYAVDQADIKILPLKRTGENEIFAGWQIDAKGVQISNPGMRANLADRLTSHNAMTNTPIAKYFAGNLRNKAMQLLGGFDLSGQGSFGASRGGYVIGLEQPLHLQGARQTMVLAPAKGGFFGYDKSKTQIQIRADIDWSGVQALKLDNFSMDAKSATGITIDTIQNISTQMRSKQAWRLNEHGENVHLAPFDIDFAYTDNGDGLRTVNIDGGIDYDGPIPGGSVLGLKADGQMQLRLHGDAFTLGYTPTEALSVEAFSNPSGWTTKALKFDLEPQTNLLRKTLKSNILKAVLKNVRTDIVDPEDTRHLSAQFERLDIQTDFTQAPQHWQIKIGGTDVKSEDFPAPGTHIVSPTANLNVYQEKNGNLTFDLLSPRTQVATDNASIGDLHIGLQGSPDDIAMEYRAGSVTMVGDAVPVLPMGGTARLKSGELTGHAITNLPKTKDTPINIHYHSLNGQGSAKILIPNIIFNPLGLQPQQLVPALRGKLAEVTGETSAEFDFVFGGGKPVRSSGWAELRNLDVGTLVGPVSGVDARLDFTSIFPLKTNGIQTATLRGFDPGFLLENGTIKFETFPDGISIHQAAWPIDNIEGTPGNIFLTPTDWKFGDVENRVQVNVENVGLGTILAGVGKDKFSATGQIYGKLPAKIKGVDVLIDDGALFVKDGGVIRYKNPATDAAVAENQGAAHAFKALENFQYKQLEARIDGPIDGDMALKIVFDGQNPEVLGGQIFQFNTQVSGELADIARNMAGAFSNEENLARVMEIKNGKTDEP